MFRLFTSGVDDLVMVSSPSNGEITKQLGARFDRELIYTNIGDVLISVNPYKRLPIFGDEHIRMYQNSSGHDATPHVFNLAEQAYRRLADDKESQCVIISGESGAGKTVAAKFILQYITEVSPSSGGSGGGGASSSGAASSSYSATSSAAEYTPPAPRGRVAPRAAPVPGGRGGGRGRGFRGAPQAGPPRGRPARPGAPGGGGSPGGGGIVRGGRGASRGRGGISRGGGGGGGGGRSGGNSVEHIKSVIIDSNPLMEAFGNAKTIRNDNSSRFGKYLEIQFDDRAAPIGGKISTFLLEKTRVAFQQKKERNFHIFYQLMKGAPPAWQQEFGIQCDPTCFHYLGQSGCTTVDGVDDAVDFHEVRKAMSTVGIGEGEQHDLCQILAGILHLGNIRFEGDAPATVMPSQQQAVDAASHLLGVQSRTLVHAITHRRIQSGSARGTQYAIPQNPDQSSAMRDALAMTLYTRIFDYLVIKINESMAYSGETPVVGVLDIYGFEIFDRNSFEQFCINYVNERLQQIFIDLTVRGEQKEYHEEGMKWKDIKFFDNKVVCELIDASRPPGIMRVLDDTCKTVHAVDSATADQKFMEKLISACGQNEYLRIAQSGAAATEFTIRHYAGDVTYDNEEFVFKNKDDLYSSLVEFMQTSTNHYALGLFPEDVGDDKKAPTTASTKIRQSANYLVKRLSACTPHYIRCIKPNDSKTPLSFNAGRVEHQVKYLGLLENVKVKRAGYAYRHFKDVFLRRFGQLCDVPPTTIQEFVQWVRTHAREINPEEFEEGKTKIFVRSPETIFTLEDMLFKKLEPEAYKERAKAYKESEKLAQAKQGKHSLKRGCFIS